LRAIRQAQFIITTIRIWRKESEKKLKP